MSKLIKLVKETALKDGFLRVHIQGQEKWNWPDNSGKSSEEPRADGHFDIEGHSWGDISLFFRLDLRRPEDRKMWWEDFKEWLSDVGGVISDSFNWRRRWLGLDSIFGFIKDTIDTVGLTKSFWGLTITSLEVYRSEMAQEKAFEIMEPTRPTEGDREDWLAQIGNKFSKYHKWIEEVRKTEEKIYDELEYKEVLSKLFSHTYKMGNGLYVDREDMTLIYANELELPFDLKSGYSDEKFLYIIRMWSDRVLGAEVNVVNTGSNPSRMKSQIAVGLVEAEARANEGEF